jgi:1-acyl-sn-glycerol-3-phosphate acyltransferase
MKQLLLNLYLLSMLVIVTLLYLLALPVSLLIQMTFFKRPLHSAIRWTNHTYGWVLVTIVPFFAPVQIRYKTENPTFPAIIVANHNSAVDPYLFGRLFKEISFVTTWPFKIPIYGFFMRLAKYINANEGWKEVCRKGEEVLRSGCSLIIWPEGHRSRNGRLSRFKNGAFALAVETGYPVLPVCIIGSRRLLPPGKKYMSPSQIRLIVLDPIYPEISCVQKEEEIIRLRTMAFEVIQNTLEDEQEKQSPTFFMGVGKGV